MARYIDADAFAERIKASPIFPNIGQEGYFCREFVLDLIDRQTTAEVVEVRRGEWLTEDCETQPLYKCSVCGKLKGCASDYCSSCGAYMKGE